MRRAYVVSAAALAAGLICCLNLALASVGAGPTPAVRAFMPLLAQVSRTPPPPTLPPPSGPVSFSIGTTVIASYPFTPFLTPVVDPARHDYPLLALDRAAYRTSNPQPTAAAYTLLVLENRYLRLTLLPGLGGRIYECIFKPTGENLLYRNPVLKPTEWGPAEPDHPAGANWWLAAGGIEWGFPVEEHGYEWATAWNWQQALLPDGSQVVTLSAGPAGRPAYPGASIRLAPDSAAFTIRPQITNTLGTPFLYKWWSNAMLAPGGQNRPGADLRFLFPVDQVTVHSSGDACLPGEWQAMSWPIYRQGYPCTEESRDLSRLGNWRGWLGFFERPAAQGDWSGVYDPVAASGLVRIFPSGVARGAKGFGMGWGQNAIPPSTWTDDGSSYVELHAGTAPTFDDWSILAGGETLSWEETWYPVAGIGQVISATARGSLSLSRSAVDLNLGLYLPRPAGPVTVTVTVGGTNYVTPGTVILPDQPFLRRYAWLPDAVPPGAPVTIAVADAAGGEVYRYEERP